MTPLLLKEIDRRFIELAAAREKLGNTPMQNALTAAQHKQNPVFVKRGTSILVMEREQFNEIQQAIGGTSAA